MTDGERMGQAFSIHAVLGVLRIHEAQFRVVCADRPRDHPQLVPVQMLSRHSQPVSGSGKAGHLGAHRRFV